MQFEVPGPLTADLEMGACCPCIAINILSGSAYSLSQSCQTQLVLAHAVQYSID